MAKNKIDISVIIATKDRPNEISFCIRALLHNHAKNIEIIIVDQSRDTNSANAVGNFNSHTITYYHKNNINGKSAALNFGIKQSKGNLIAFTDDDCIVSNNWIKEMVTSFSKHSDISCLTGNVYPYKNYPKWTCQPTISTKKFTFSIPTYHVKIGFGNNFAIRKSALNSIGLFKTWLGPGSITAACEDGEIILRLLTKGHKIFHNPDVIVYHKKKLNSATLIKQNLSYVCGEMACYGYLSFLGYDFAKKIISNNFIESYHDMRKNIGDILKRRIINVHNWEHSITKICFKILGYLVGLFFYIREVRLNNNLRYSIKVLR